MEPTLDCMDLSAFVSAADAISLPTTVQKKRGRPKGTKNAPKKTIFTDKTVVDNNGVQAVNDFSQCQNTFDLSDNEVEANRDDDISLPKQQKR